MLANNNLNFKGSFYRKANYSIKHASSFTKYFDHKSRLYRMKDRTSTDIIVSSFKETDKEDVKKLVIDVQEEAYGEADSPSELNDLNNISTHYQGNKFGGFWSAKVDGKIVGVIALKVNEVNDVLIATLKRLYVREEYRGSKKYGIASKLLATLIQQARNGKIKNVYLGTTLEPPAAFKFFQKNEFIQIEKTEMPEGSIISEHDTHFFVRPLVYT